MINSWTDILGLGFCLIAACALGEATLLIMDAIARWWMNDD